MVEPIGYGKAPIVKTNTGNRFSVLSEEGSEREPWEAHSKGKGKVVNSWSDASLRRTGTWIETGDGGGRTPMWYGDRVGPLADGNYDVIGVERRDHHLKRVRFLKRKMQLDSLMEKGCEPVGKGVGSERSKKMWARITSHEPKGGSTKACERVAFVQNIVEKSRYLTENDLWRDPDEDSDASYETLTMGSAV